MFGTFSFIRTFLLGCLLRIIMWFFCLYIYLTSMPYVHFSYFVTTNLAAILYSHILYKIIPYGVLKAQSLSLTGLFKVHTQLL